MSAPLAIFGTINGFELLVVAAAALMVFGSRLPEVALRAVAHVMRARRAVSKMWRDTGLEEELRRVRRDIELNVPRAADFDVQPSRSIDPHDDSVDPDEARADEYYDSSVDIMPAEDTIATGEWSADGDVDRREPAGLDVDDGDEGEDEVSAAVEGSADEGGADETDVDESGASDSGASEDGAQGESPRRVS